MKRVSPRCCALVAGLCVLFFSSLAQEKCGHGRLIKERERAYPGSTGHFEQWLRQHAPRPTDPVAQIEEPIYTLPVVVHIIYEGEPVGIGSNLSDERITEQLRILNEDFRRLNGDASETSPSFLSAARDCRIAFELARRDPYGLPTSGITRTLRLLPVQRRDELPQMIMWPPTDYLNIWTIPSHAGGHFEGILGLSSFPITERGSFGSLPFSLLDGIIVKSHKVGVQENSRGRTATHEIGHFLGLRHTWGDGGCDRDDFCGDTPLSGSFSSKCDIKHSCGSRDMIENYMDYTPDRCMNLFTACQKRRMRTVLEHDPIRHQLLSSRGREPPPVVQNDAGILHIVRPRVNECADHFIPEVELANYGTNDIHSLTVAMKVDGTIQQTKTITPSAFRSYGRTTLHFDEYTPVRTAYRTFTFEITEINGSPDPHPENNAQSVTLMQHEFFRVDAVESFESEAPQWLLAPESLDKAAVISAPDKKKKALKFLLSAREGQKGQEYALLSPIIDMSHYAHTDLLFTFRYSYSGGFGDGDYVTGLRAVVYERCRAQHREHQIFNRYGDELITTSLSAPHALPPESAWRTVKLFLSDFKEHGDIQLALLARSGGVRDLYLDDVSVVRTEAYDYDVGIEDVRVSYKDCGRGAQHMITLRNYGKKAQEQAVILVLQVGKETALATERITVPAPTLWQENSTWLHFSTSSRLAEGEYWLTVQLDSELVDEYEKNNAATSAFYLHQRRDHPPSLENFEQRQKTRTQWYMPSGTYGGKWEVIPHGTQGSSSRKVARLALYGQDAADYWMMSPVYDFSGVETAMLSFEVAYANRGTAYDELQLLASTDCGAHFTKTLYTKGGETLAVKSTFRRWAPESAEDWRREVIDLEGLVGEEAVQLAFVGRSGGGNDLYLDDIEIFNRNSTVKVASRAEQVRLYPNPAGGVVHLSFHLSEKASVALQLYNLSGQRIKENKYPNTLNQIYDFPLPQKERVYILQVLENNRNLRSFRVLSE